MKAGVITVAPSPHLAGTLAALGRSSVLGVEVRCLSDHLQGREWEGEAKGVGWQVVGRRGEGGLAAFLAGLDCLIVATSYFRLASFHAAVLARARGLPWVVWWEPPSSFSSLPVRSVRPAFIKWFLQRASGVAGITEATADLYRRSYGFTGSVTWCPYHRDLSVLKSLTPRSPTEARVRFLVLGSLVPRKAVDVAIRALVRVPEPACLRVVGSGPERRRLERLAEALVPGRVEFLGGLPYSQAASAFDGVHALVIPSHHDGFGMTVMEALAAGVPVIASDHVASAVQYVKDGHNGWVVPAGDPGALAGRMTELVRRWQDWPRFSRESRASLSVYDPGVDAQRLARFCFQLGGRVP